MHQLLEAFAKRLATPADPLPEGTPWLGVIAARVLTRLANGAFFAIPVIAYYLCYRYHLLP
jgi:hypothetical protein